jgi:hypothetical protein
VGVALVPLNIPNAEMLFFSYAWTVDHKLWREYESLFTPDAVIDYTAAGGRRGSPPEIAAWLAGVYDPAIFYINRHQHLITNIEIKATGKDTAKVTAAFTAPMSLPFFPLEYGPFATVGGWYVVVYRYLGFKMTSTVPFLLLVLDEHPYHWWL